MAKNKCEICGSKIVEIHCTEVTVTVWTQAGVSLSGNGSVRTRKICNKDACALALFTEMRDAAQRKVDKNRTNAIGPLPKGAPGCMFNGD